MTSKLLYACLTLGINIAEYGILSSFFRRYLTRKTHKLYLLYFAVFIMVLYWVNLYQKPALNGLTASALVFGYALLCYSGHITKLFAFSAIYIAISSMSEMLVSFVVSIISSIPLTLTVIQTATYALSGVVGKALTYVLTRLIVVKYPLYFELDRSRDLLLLSLFPATAVISMHVILEFDSRLQLSAVEHILTILLLIVFLAVCILIFFVYYSAMQKKQLENEVVLNLEIRSMGEKMFRQQMSEFESMNRLQHEFKRHLNTILDYVQCRKYEQIDEYCAQVEQYLYAAKLTHPIDFNNYTLSAQYARLRYECDQNHINLETDIRFKQFGYLSEIHANIIFGNLFDNAINACSLIEGAERHISFVTYRVGGYVIILLSNSKHNDIILSPEGVPLSTHREYKSVGCGISNILETAELYGGYYTFEFTDTRFKAWVRLGTDNQMH